MIMQEKTYTNRLNSSNNPYLLQHANNPVDWYPWGEEALQKARDEKKMLFISIGYSSCHWCHVMAHESFMDKEIARFLNQHYVSIKIDREERPDLDNYYMTAVQLMSQQGGWPLTCFALPDGRPVFGGTYFPPKAFMNVLTQLLQTYTNASEKVYDYARDLEKGIRQVNTIVPAGREGSFSREDIETLIRKRKENFDSRHGGSKGAPKFPTPVSFGFLIEYAAITGDSTITKHIDLSLENMASAGLYDHLGGGFYRYAVDSAWQTPHFEKMLYDNAQLIELYARAYRFNPKKEYKTVVDHTLHFLVDQMKSDEGGFFSAYDADSEGKEGAYYTWTLEELESVLGKDARLFADYFQITEEGNWENGANILRITTEKEKVAANFGLSQEALENNIEVLKMQLLKIRNKREKPFLDDKMILSWNALLLKALVVAYHSFSDDRYAKEARELAKWIYNYMIREDYELIRVRRKGLSTEKAFLDDYANTIRALIAVYQVDFDENWLKMALALMKRTGDHFYDESSGFFAYHKTDDVPTAAVNFETMDSVIPSSNAVMAMNLQLLSWYFEEYELDTMSNQMVEQLTPKMMKHPEFYGLWAKLLVEKVYVPPLFAFSGKKVLEYKSSMAGKHLGEVFYAGHDRESELPLLRGKKTENGTAIWLCVGKVCMSPVHSPEEALMQLAEFRD